MTSKPKLHATRCGDTLFVYDDERQAEVERELAKRLLAGGSRSLCGAGGTDAE